LLSGWDPTECEFEFGAESARPFNGGASILPALMNGVRNAASTKYYYQIIPCSDRLNYRFLKEKRKSKSEGQIASSLDRAKHVEELVSELQL
jgi:hypothetical protein